MQIKKKMALAISGLAVAGATSLTLGAAAPANAQTVTATPHHAVTATHTECGWGGCWGDWGWGWDSGWGWDGGWGGWC